MSRFRFNCFSNRCLGLSPPPPLRNPIYFMTILNPPFRSCFFSLNYRFRLFGGFCQGLSVSSLSHVVVSKIKKHFQQSGQFSNSSDKLICIGAGLLSDLWPSSVSLAHRLPRAWFGLVFLSMNSLRIENRPDWVHEELNSRWTSLALTLSMRH